MLIFIVIISACKPDEVPTNSNLLDQQIEHLLLIKSAGKGKNWYRFPDKLSEIPSDPQNPLSLEKVELGKLLFHETGLALNPKISSNKGTYSCASCHHASSGFGSGLSQGIGEGGLGSGKSRIYNNTFVDSIFDVQPLRTPTALNTAYQELMLWNGQFGATGTNTQTQDMWKEGTPMHTNFMGYTGVETQAIAGLKVHRMMIDSTFFIENNYEQLFEDAFPNLPNEEKYTREKVGLAIAAYERTLLASESPWQKWLAGDYSAMNDLEKSGAYLFFGKGECVVCHNGPALNSNSFHAIGMADLSPSMSRGVSQEQIESAGEGRGQFTGRDQDMYKFKVPQLYNLADMSFYGHGASFSSIKEVLTYKNKANPQQNGIAVSPYFQPLQLTEEEIDALTTFLGTALYDPALSRYIPDHLPSGNCFPNADEWSKLLCE